MARYSVWIDGRFRKTSNRASDAAQSTACAPPAAATSAEFNSVIENGGVGGRAGRRA